MLEAPLYQYTLDYFFSFVIWAIAVYGTANILVYSTIMQPFRNLLGKVNFFGKLINCILCTGFWVGMVWGYIIWSPAEYLMLRPYMVFQPVIDLLFNGVVGSCLCWVIYLHLADKMVGK